MSEPRPIALDAIRADTQAQPRASMLMETIEGYIERMREGDVFPPLVVFFDGAVHWLGDGFHRYHAAKGLGLTEFACDVREGGLREAVLHSVGANAAHGLQRSNEDKRRAVMKLLGDTEWSQWSDREIARRCAVSPQTVNNIRPKDTVQNGQYERTFTHPKTGKPTTMNVGNIGGSPRPRPSEPAWTSADLPAPTIPAHKPAPDPQHARDLANGILSSLIWEIGDRFDQLPAAVEFVDRFPTHHHHTLTAARLRRMSDWFGLAADAWEERIEEARNVAAE